MILLSCHAIVGNPGPQNMLYDNVAKQTVPQENKQITSQLTKLLAIFNIFELYIFKCQILRLARLINEPKSINRPTHFNYHITIVMNDEIDILSQSPFYNTIQTEHKHRTDYTYNCVYT